MKLQLEFCKGSKSLIRRLAPAFCTLLLLLVSIRFEFKGMGDVQPYYLTWINEMLTQGPVAAFRQPGGFDQYPPLAVFGAYLIKIIFGFSLLLSWKISGALALVATSEILYFFTKSSRIAIFPVIVLGIPTVWWGYADVHIAPFLLLSLCFILKSQYRFAGIFFALSCLFKWQPIIFFPVIIYFLVTKTRVRPAINFTSGTLVVATFVVAVYGWYNPLKSIWLSSLNHYFSAWGPNLYWIVTWVLSKYFPNKLGELGIWGGGPTEGGMFSSLQGNPKVGLFLIAKCIFYSVFLSYLFIYSIHSKFSNLNIIRLLAAVGVIYWQFSTGVHTNHIFFLLPISIILIWMDPRYLKHFLFIFGLIFIDLFARLGIDGTGLWALSGIIPPGHMALLLSFLSLPIAVVLLISLMKDGTREH